MHRSTTDNGAAYDVRRVRLLLEFIEQLEKVMYNAADGTATALLPPPKVVIFYFRVCDYVLEQ